MEKIYLNIAKWKEPVWRLQIIWFQLYDIMEKSKDSKRSVISRDWGEGREE